MGRSRNGHRIDAELQQCVEIVDGRTAQHAINQITLSAIRIGHADKRDARQPRQYTGMIGTHDADANNTRRSVALPSRLAP